MLNNISSAVIWYHNFSCSYRQDPRLRHSRAQQPGFEGPVNQQRAPQGGRQATASVPLYESRPQPSYRQQDADGRFGDPQDSAVSFHCSALSSHLIPCARGFSSYKNVYIALHLAQREGKKLKSQICSAMAYICLVALKKPRNLSGLRAS